MKLPYPEPGHWSISVSLVYSDRQQLSRVSPQNFLPDNFLQETSGIGSRAFHIQSTCSDTEDPSFQLPLSFNLKHTTIFFHSYTRYSDDHHCQV